MNVHTCKSSSSYEYWWTGCEAFTVFIAFGCCMFTCMLLYCTSTLYSIQISSLESQSSKDVSTVSRLNMELRRIGGCLTDSNSEISRLQKAVSAGIWCTCIYDVYTGWTLKTLRVEEQCYTTPLYILTCSLFFWCSIKNATKPQNSFYLLTNITTLLIWGELWYCYCHMT